MLSKTTFLEQFPLFDVLSSEEMFQLSQMVELKKRPKYTGFEQVMDLDRHYRNQLKERFPDHDAIFYSEYFNLLEGLHGLS